MKCTNCGYDNIENARFCQGCGAELPPNRQPLSERLLQLLNDNNFMVLCILFSVSTGFSLIGGGLPVIGILMTIFLWIAFAQSKKGIISPNYIRNISGTIFASYVINWVLCGLMALCGILLIILSATVDMTELWNRLAYELGPYMYDYLEGFGMITNFFLIFVSIALIIIAVVIACFNVFGRRTIHRFVQSIYKNLESGQMYLTKCGAAKTWMMVFGIVNAISAVLALARAGIFSFLEEGCLSAVFFLSSVMVSKYFGDLEGKN